jgi:hypothetical protein
MWLYSYTKTKQMENQQQETTDQQKSIFDDDIIDTSEYDKKIKSAQTSIFVVAGVQMLFSLIYLFSNDGPEMYFSFGIMAFVSLLFLGLGFWCKKKPLAAIVTALVIYVSLLLLDACFDPTTLYKGIIMKAFIIIYLAKGIGAAKEAKRLKEIMGQE